MPLSLYRSNQAAPAVAIVAIATIHALNLSCSLFEDAMIAATARVHRLTVVTRYVRDFHKFEVELFDPFKGK